MRLNNCKQFGCVLFIVAHLISLKSSSATADNKLKTKVQTELPAHIRLVQNLTNCSSKRHPTTRPLNETKSHNNNNNNNNKLPTQKCLKKCRVNKDCRGRSRLCLCDGLCGPSCVRPKLKCRDLGVLMNGWYELSPTDGGFASVVRYTCEAGYMMIGPPERTCQGDRTWSGVAPTCHIDGRCGDPPLVDMATHSNPPVVDTSYHGYGRLYELGTELIYTCATGYNAEGYYKATCMAEGRWIGPNMVCSPKRCSSPGQIPNSQPLDTSLFMFPNIITYQCLDGYELVGEPTRQCLHTGQWSGQLPVCRPVKCPPLSPVVNGHVISYSDQYGSIVRYRCDAGYELEGPVQRVCQADGTWSDNEAQCPAVDCGSTGPFYNGFKQEFQTTFGSTIQFRCVGGATMNTAGVPETDITCTAHGNWSDIVPTCWSGCKRPEIEHGGVDDNVGDYLQHDTVIEYQCQSDYVTGTEPARCYNGSWTFTPTCIPAPCTHRPREIKNGRFRYHTAQHGDYAKYWCDPGFQLQGSRYVKCNYGNWSEDNLPTCKRVYCPHPGAIENGQIMLIGIGGKFNYRPYVKHIGHNDQIEFVCDKDFLRIGPTMATCVHQTWSPPKKPKCVPKTHPGVHLLHRGRRHTNNNKTRVRDVFSALKTFQRISSIFDNV